MISRKLIVVSLLVLLPASGHSADIVECVPHYSQVSATCAMSGHSEDGLLRIRSNVVAGGKLLIGGTIEITDKGAISGVRCEAVANDAIDVDCPGSVVLPGLVNLHEHLNYSASPALEPPVHPLRSRYEWQRNPEVWPGERVRKTRNSEELSLVEIRHLLSGTTSLAGRDQVDGLLRNLDAGSTKVVENITFPYGQQDADLPKDCLAKPLVDYRGSMLVHAGEGVDETSRTEIRCMVDNWKKFSGPGKHLTIVHAIAVDQPLAATMAESNIGIVWSPVSNMRLYGATIPVDMLRSQGVNVSLGTDWLASGSPSLKEEAQYVRVARDSLHWQVSDDDLLSMMTLDPAMSVGLKGEIGDISVGASADLFAVALADDEPSHALAGALEATPAKTQWVVVQGKFKFLPSAWEDAARQHRWITTRCESLPQQACLPSGVICGPSTVLRAIKRSDASGLLCPAYNRPSSFSD